MSKSLVGYEFDGKFATITLDDGKRNALSPKMLAAIHEAFDRAEQDKAIVILTGREDVFSAGFDLKVMRAGGANTLSMLKSGYSLTAHVLSYPYPVIAACSGHALAMGTFLLLSCDYRIGITGDYKFAANEVAIGLPMPRVAVEMLRLRLTPSAFQRAVVLSEYSNPEQAVTAGFLDRVVAPEALMSEARKVAEAAAELDMHAHTVSKLRIRDRTIRTIRRSIPLDLKDAVMLGVRSVVKSKLG